ncbi:VOC family protein [Arthrobacter sp. LAPM80]|uniref:VOC family protein n=1 Tax=Arthrobacter sp. LAPM80 TaxID=3141788 RepID=UPI00398ABBBD
MIVRDGALIHAEIRIGDSVIMISNETADGAPAQATLSLNGAALCVMVTHWADVDTAWSQAIAAGAEVMYARTDQFHGERGGRLRDPFSRHVPKLAAQVTIAHRQALGG